MWGGVPVVNVYAHPETHRLFNWVTIPTDWLHTQPEGTVQMDPGMMRKAYAEAKAVDDEIRGILENWLHPQPPNSPARLRLVS
jgi:hypothetical protein